MSNRKGINKNQKQMKTINIQQLRLILLVFSYIGLTHISHSQEHDREYYAGISASFMGLDYQNPQTTNEPALGGGISLGYTRFFEESRFYWHPIWGISVGLEFFQYNTTAKTDVLKDSYFEYDIDNELFDFRYQLKGVEEKYQVNMLNLPIGLQYQKGGMQSLFYIKAGGKLGVALTSSYKTQMQGLTTSGYYPEHNVELHDPLFMGFGDFSDKASKEGKIKAQFSFALFLESGIKFRLNNSNKFLYLGAFAEYGLVPLLKGNNDKNSITYNKENPIDFTYNHLFDTGNNKNLRTIALGISLKYSFTR
ncbi:MAG: hypothetical protein ACTJGD_03000 [Mesonia hippocampi]|uniref:hypothetical protein n=1 Tax=Mesonia hippocampi TaxID=1628250 RepID=UPI003F949BE5